MKRHAGLAALAALAFSAIGGGALAAEHVTNGGFEATLLPVSGEFGGDFPSQQVTGWTTNGYNFVFRSGEADSGGGNGSFGNLQLWGPDNGSANGLPDSSPAGGNFIASDPVFIHDSIRQDINDLTIGKTYNLSFYWAGAQQFGFSGDTFEGWQVSLGGETHSTSTVNVPDHGFSGWQLATMSFTATAASETLAFLSTGGPTGLPPFALLDGVSLTDVTGGGVPEPAAWALMILGFGASGAALRRRRVAAA